MSWLIIIWLLSRLGLDAGAWLIIGSFLVSLIVYVLWQEETSRLKKKIKRLEEALARKMGWDDSNRITEKASASLERAYLEARATARETGARSASCHCRTGAASSMETTHKATMTTRIGGRT